jgi:tetratricopeptide (TPR) repeat protein
MKTAVPSFHVVLVSLLAVMAIPVMAADDWTHVRVEQSTITLPTYAWYEDVNPLCLGDSIYPYTRQDHIAKDAEPREYKTIELENRYLKVICLPELGGRLFRVIDKTTDEDMFHYVKEIKPALIAMRGAFITGGVEWNPGPTSHTVTLVSPVDVTVVENADGSATLVVGNTEKIRRTRWTVRLTLHPDKAYLDESIRMFNPTDGMHSYYFWNCTAFPCLPGTRFIYPMTLGTDHNGTRFYSWPVNGDKDLSWLKNYDTMSSIFGYECGFDFFGAYDVDLDRGIVSHANHREVKGKKAWTWGQDDFGIVSQMALSDGGRTGAPYIEVQSGPLLTQSDFGMLKPRQEKAWREYWYPVHGLGDAFEYATKDVAAQTVRQGNALEVRLIPTAEFPGAECSLSKDGRTLHQETLDLTPLAPVAMTLEEAPDGPLSVKVVGADGQTLLAYETPLSIPKVGAPDLTEKLARADGEPTAQELYRRAFRSDCSSWMGGARGHYGEVLKLDPGHTPSLMGIAAIDIEQGRFEDAATGLDKAVQHDPDTGMAWYLLGVAKLNLGDFEAAKAHGYEAAHTLGPVAQGYNLAGRARMRMKDYDGAIADFARAMSEAPRDSENRNAWFAARLAAGDTAVFDDVRPIIHAEDPTDFVPRAQAGLQSADAMDAFIADVAAIAGEKEFTVTEAALFFANLGLTDEAERIFRALCEQKAFPVTPMAFYYHAHFADHVGADDLAESSLTKAAQMNPDYAMPARVEALPALAHAVEASPQDANAHLLCGQALSHFGRRDEAEKHWKQAADLNPNLSQAWYMLARLAQSRNEKDAAADLFAKALAARPTDQVCRRDLAKLLGALGRRDDGIELVKTMPANRTPRYDLILWLADAYMAEERYDDCIALLDTARFSNWEGSSRPHDIFVDALTKRGIGYFEAGQLAEALADFEKALTFPANLEVGARYELTDAEVRYWLGRTLMAMGRDEDARKAWETGAAQMTKDSARKDFIALTDAQDTHVKKCRTALELVGAP